MAKRNKNKSNNVNIPTSMVDKDFEQHLNTILKSYRNQGNLLKKINQIKRNSSQLTSSLSTKQQKILANTIRRYEVQEKIRKNLLSTDNIHRNIMNSLRYTYNYLEQNDEIIKSSAISLGLSRGLSDQYRQNLLDSARYAASLGLSLKELAVIQQAYTNETGQSALLSAKALEAVTQITQGTGLSAENAGTLVGQFKLLGLNAENTRDFVESTAKETTKLGVSLNKVLSDINTNFKQIQSYNFSNGINGVQKMAMYANMYKISMQDTFASIDKARTLEGAVEMSARLMVMGGEFSKQNMFEIGFLARNRPEEFMKKLNEMNRSVYHFNERTGEIQSSAFDLDRLRAVAEATGVPFENLNQQARRIAEIDFAKTKLTSNLSADEKDFIANLATFNKSTGKFEIQLGSDAVDIRNIGRQQLQAIREQQDSLEKRANDSMTFDKQFRNSIEELKTLALPLIKTLNTALRGIQNIGNQFGDWSGVVKLAMIGGAGVIVAGLSKFTATLLSGMSGVFTNFLAGLSTRLSIGGTTGDVSTGKGFMGKLGGAAGSAMAVGGAFLAASYGISMIADSFKQLNPEQLDAITAAIVTMGISIPASIFAISLAGKAGAIGIGIVTGAMLGLGLAAMGIGKGIEFATNGLSKMFSVLPEVAESISKIGIGLATFVNPLTLYGILGFTGFLKAISSSSGDIDKLSVLAESMANGTNGFKAFGDAIDKVSMVNNDKTIEKITSLINQLNNIQISNPFNELKELLSKPLKVEFADNNVDMVVNISNVLDGKVISKNIYPHIAKITKSNQQNK